MTSQLTSKRADDQGYDGFTLSTKEGVHVGWITWNIKTRKYEPMLMNKGCSDGTSFTSLEAAEYCAFAHHCENMETLTSRDQHGRAVRPGK